MTVVLLGLPGVGRSTLLCSLAQGTTSKLISNASGESFDTFTVLVDGAAVGVHLIAPHMAADLKAADAPGIGTVDGVLLVYDLTNRNSIDSLVQWYSVCFFRFTVS